MLAPTHRHVARHVNVSVVLGGGNPRHDADICSQGQCLPELKNKLDGTQGYDTAKNANNVAKLLMMIRGYCCQFNLLSDKYMAILAAIKNLLYFFQKVEQSNADYHKDFMAMLEVIEEYGGSGSMTHFPNILKQELKAEGTDITNTSTDKIKKQRRPFARSFLLLSC